MRNNTTILLRAMARLLIAFLEVRLPVDISWSCSASRYPRPEPATIPGAEREDSPAPEEIELTHTLAMMALCRS
jgi:hypothetical protein